MTFWNWGLNKDRRMSTADVITEVDGVSRRDFLRAGSLTVVGLSSASALASSIAASSARRAIFILMTGGVSQLETFDPKPESPSAIRGPFKSIETSVAGVRFGESLPLLARRADRFSVIRSLNHDAAPIHETGQQLLQTGQLSSRHVTFPHWGCLVSQAVPARNGVPGNVILPGRVENTGVSAYRGQAAGSLGNEWEPAIDSMVAAEEPDSIRRMYGDSSFGRQLLRARQLVEAGTRCVTVNLFSSLGKQITWDCHGDANCGPATLNDYQDRLCPEFDLAMSGLLDDLAQRGLFDDTLVIATGEFGRTPRINDNFGRDHWTSCWSAMVAGGRTRTGQVIGASDARGSEPIERPVHPAELTATLVAWYGIDAENAKFDANGNRYASVEHKPLHELWS